MLRNTQELENFSIGATDGHIGHVKDFYFDDQAWVIRYFVVDTGTWLSSRKVLVSPVAVGNPNWVEKVLPVMITKQQVKDSPDIDTDKPVSRQQESDFLGYYGYPNYWGGPGLWEGGIYPNMPPQSHKEFVSTRRDTIDSAHAETGALDIRPGNPHLRSTNAMIGYHIHAVDGDIGHVTALLVDEMTWAIRYLVVDSSNWWLGHRVLLMPSSIKAIDWSASAVTVDMTRQALRDAPPYDGGTVMDRVSEIRLHEHHNTPGYWVSEKEHEAARSRKLSSPSSPPRV